MTGKSLMIFEYHKNIKAQGGRGVMVCGRIYSCAGNCFDAEALIFLNHFARRLTGMVYNLIILPQSMYTCF